MHNPLRGDQKCSDMCRHILYKYLHLYLSCQINGAGNQFGLYLHLLVHYWIEHIAEILSCKSSRAINLSNFLKKVCSKCGFFALLLRLSFSLSKSVTMFCCFEILLSSAVLLMLSR